MIQDDRELRARLNAELMDLLQRLPVAQQYKFLAEHGVLPPQPQPAKRRSHTRFVELYLSLSEEDKLDVAGLVVAKAAEREAEAEAPEALDLDIWGATLAGLQF